MPPLSLDFDQLETMCSQASFTAAARPAMAGMFSVPALFPLACAPPSIAPLYDSVPSSTSINVDYELRLGSTSLSLEEINSLNVGTILPLVNSEQGVVWIISNGRVCGKGVLLVVDGKLALRIESIDSESSSQ